MYKLLRYFVFSLSLLVLLLVGVLSSLVYYTYDTERSFSYIDEHVDEFIESIFSDIDINVDQVKLKYNSESLNFNVVLNDILVQDEANGIQIKLPKIYTGVNWRTVLMERRFSFNKIVIDKGSITLDKRIELDMVEGSASSIELVGYSISHHINKAIDLLEDLGINLAVRNLDIMYKGNSDNLLCIKYLNVLSAMKSDISNVELVGAYKNEDFKISMNVDNDQKRSIIAKFNNFRTEIISDNLVNNDFINELEFKISGDILIDFDKDLSIEDIHIDIDRFNGKVPGLINQSIKTIELFDTEIEMNKNIISSSKVNVFVNDQVLYGHFLWDLNVGTKGQLKLDFNIGDFNFDRINWLWPAELEPKMRKAIFSGFREGDLTDINVKIDVELDKKISYENVSIYGVMKNAEFIIDKDLHGKFPVISNIDAKLSFNHNNLIADISVASYGSVSITNAKVSIDDLFDNKNHIMRINGDASSSTQSLYEVAGYINEDLHLDESYGIADTEFMVNIPLESKDKLWFVVNSKLRDLKIPKIYNTFDITDGDCYLSFTPELVVVRGDGLIEGKSVIFSIDYDMHKHKGKYDVEGEVSIDSLYNSGLIPQWDEMALSGDVALKINVRSDAGGINTYGDIKFKDIDVDIKRLEWSGKDSGSLHLDVIKRGREITVNELSVTSDVFHIQNTKAFFGDNTKYVSIDKLRFIENDIALSYEDNGEKILVYISGKKMMLPSFVKAAAELESVEETEQDEFVYKGLNFGYKKMDIKVVVDDLIMKNEHVMQDLLIDIKYDNESYLGSKVSGRYTDDNYIRGEYFSSGFEFIADDAGILFNSLGLYDNLHSGVLYFNIYEPESKGAPVKGMVYIKKFGLANAPALAKILTLASLQGIVSILNGGEAISFASAYTSFLYKEGEINFTNGLAEGESIGIKFSGPLSFITGDYKIRGSVIPAYFINRVISKIPLLGRAITGGDNEGIVAFNYRADGRWDKYVVKVNTLSILAPGFLRKILSIFYKDDDSEDSLSKSKKSKKKGAKKPNKSKVSTKNSASNNKSSSPSTKKKEEKVPANSATAPNKKSTKSKNALRKKPSIKKKTK